MKLWVNFINGLARGFLIAIESTMLGAVAIYVLNLIVKINLLYIGETINEIVKVVQESMQKAR